MRLMAENTHGEQAIVNSQCKPDNSWIDPLHKRPLLKGEFACAVSHLRVWQKILIAVKMALFLRKMLLFMALIQKK